MSTRARSTPYQRPARADFSAAQRALEQRPQAKEAESVALGTRVIVSNLHYEITAQDLVKIFSPFGSFSRDPAIKYDRSGRSTGVGYVNFVRQSDAESAKADLDGVNAKGEPISIKIDTSVPRQAPGRAASLKGRIGNAPLISRLSDKDIAMAEANSSRNASGPGPVRHPRGSGAGSRVVSDGRPAAPRGAGGPRGKGAKPKTVDDLDKELDDFMKDSGTDEKTGAAVVDEDVAMAA